MISNKTFQKHTVVFRHKFHEYSGLLRYSISTEFNGNRTISSEVAMEHTDTQK